MLSGERPASGDRTGRAEARYRSRLPLKKAGRVPVRRRRVPAPPAAGGGGGGGGGGCLYTGLRELLGIYCFQ